MNFIIKAFIILLLSMLWMNSSYAIFIQPTSVVSNAADFYNTPAVLIDAATGNGGINYSAPNVGSGGGGTSWWTSTSGATGVVLTFDFNVSQNLEEFYLWDYTAHTPINWKLKLFSDVSGAGTELLDFDFSITTGPSPTSTKHVLDFTDVNGVLSGTLTTLIASQLGGVGLAEIGFTASEATTVPEPSTLVLLGSGFLGIIGYGYRRYYIRRKVLSFASFNLQST